MSKKYQVTWAVVAQRDLEQIIEYIEIDSPGNAPRILKRIRQKAFDLYTMPDRGRIVPELKEQGMGVARKIDCLKGSKLDDFRFIHTRIFGVHGRNSLKNS